MVGMIYSTMVQIVTHSGSAHLDDFLSVCLILSKDTDAIRILRKPDVSEEEMQDRNIWKVDIGMIHDPLIHAFDHHQEGIDDCAFSLLLKHWGLWEKAKEVYSWVPAMVKIDTSGLDSILSHHRISYDTYFRLMNSFVEEAIMNWFQKCEIISKKKNKVLFYTMKGIGKQFLAGINDYYRLLEDFDANMEVKLISNQGIEEEIEKGFPIFLYLTKTPQYNANLVKIFYSFKTKYYPNYYGPWITAFTYDRPKNTICLRRHGNPKKINLSRLESLEKTEFAHPKGYVAVVKMMDEIELTNYIQHSLN
ncbi:MAG: hypothetical protein BAJALOKI1v1_70022 [Promethearchaeota archaeon]|nr:MAG: hypothetical protein BAJALOKI1v1_70022 [Candidatus Lokiarchaeota archaeon]